MSAEWAYTPNRVLSSHVLGEFSPSQNLQLPQELCHVGNYNLNIEAK